MCLLIFFSIRLEQLLLLQTSDPTPVQIKKKKKIATS